MKVCFIVGTLGRGGAERQLLYMLQALKEGGVEARVLSLTNNEPYEAQIKDLGIPVEWVGRSGSRFARLANIVGSIKRDRPDIIQSSHFYTNFYAAAAGRLLNIKCIGAIRNNVRSEMDANGIFGQLHLRMPSTLIANSRSAIDIAINDYSVGSTQLELLPNVVTSAARVQTNAELGRVRNKSQAFTILFAGRLVAQKRPELFVELASRLSAELPDRHLRFVIAGDGPLRETIRTKIRERSLNKQFSMLGEVADMSTVYTAADLLVMTSSHEGTPNVILEAMANGIPVVATKVGGIPDLLGDDRGLLVDVDDLDELSRAAKRIVEDEQLSSAFMQNGREYVAENHSVSQLRGRLLEIYGELSGARKN